ncbi:MAG: AsnC family transcriptional regulator [Lentisphaerae bacterium GWF2_52_8]|nr:MAG: AsnC family transcriptional regulator [Lentisphaerae bacterium GWF2_52_8]
MLTRLQKEIVRILSENARIGAKEISMRLESTEKEVIKQIQQLEKDGIIKGYRAIIEEGSLSENAVKAIIEVKVRPERDGGFDRIAKRLSKFPEVSSLYLMSGGYDLQIVVKGKDLQEVASFVASKLSTIDGVTSTATHFLLKKYKESGKILHDEEEYERLKISP